MPLSEWLGKAKIDFYHAATPRSIKQKDGTDRNLLKICEDSTPPCYLNPLLGSGHLQTMWTATKPEGPSIYYRRKVFNAEQEAYHGTFAVDFVVKPFEESDPTLSNRTVYFTDNQFARLKSEDSKPMLVVLHGLSGGSHEVYLRHTIAPLVDSGNWEICIVNSRGCAKSKITSGILYNARATWDIRQVVRWLRKTFPNRPLFGLGFSLGANMLTNYCGEEGPNCQLKAAVVCSNPFNLEITSKLLQNSLIGREIYLRYMGASMKSLIQTHKKEIDDFTNIDVEAVMKTTYLYEFDREIQCPTWGYPTEDAYYRDATSSDAVLAIRIPFVAISATDDPIALKQALPFEEFRQNPSTVLVTTSLGGHLSWFEFGGGRWFPRPVCNFLNHMAFNVDLDSVEPSKAPTTTESVFKAARFDPMRRKMGIVR